MGEAKITFWHHVERILLNAFLCVCCGLGLGTIAGSVIPIIGTIYGGILGLIMGAICAPVVVPLVHRRNLRIVWLWLSLPSLALCVACMLLGWATLSTQSTQSLFSVAIFGSFGGSLILFVGGAIVLRVVCPAVWPPAPDGVCTSCGYSLNGLHVLNAAVCPECGTKIKHEQFDVQA